MASTKSAHAHVGVSPQNGQIGHFSLKIHEKTYFFRTKQVQKHTPFCRRLVKTLGNDRTQISEQPKKLFNLTQKFHTTRIEESNLFALFAPHPEQLETNELHHQTRQRL